MCCWYKLITSSMLLTNPVSSSFHRTNSSVLREGWVILCFLTTCCSRSFIQSSWFSFCRFSPGLVWCPRVFFCRCLITVFGVLAPGRLNYFWSLSLWYRTSIWISPACLFRCHGCIKTTWWKQTENIFILCSRKTNKKWTTSWCVVWQKNLSSRGEIFKKIALLKQN